MDENTAASNADGDGMRSILEAAIGLSSLGVPATSPPQEIDGAIAPPKSDDAAAATALQKPGPEKSARKKPKVTTTSKKRKTAAAMAAASMPRPAPPPAYHDQLPLFTRQIDCGATGPLLPPAPGNRIMTQRRVVHRPTPYPHLFPEYPNPPPATPSFTSQLRSNIPTDNFALPSKGQKNSQRSQAHQPTQQTHYPAQHATNDIPVGEPSSASITLNFPEILYAILTSPSNAHILSWLPHGRGFVIYEKQLFASQILPQHFDGTKFTSFTRRLKRWKFERVSRGPEMGAYYNKYFVRDRLDLVRGMTYGMEDGEQLMEEKGEQLNENQGSQDEKKKKSEENNEKEKQLETVQASSLECAHDDDTVVEAAIKLHRQQQRQLKRNMDEAVMANDEGQGVQIKKKKREKKKNARNKSDTVTSFGATYDDAVVEAAMEVHRHKLKLQQQQLFKESQNIHQEKYWQQQQQQTIPPSRTGRSSPEKLPMPYNPNDSNLPDKSNMTWLNDTQVHQQQQSKRLQTQSSKESLGNSMSRPNQLPSKILHTSQLGYQDPNDYTLHGMSNDIQVQQQQSNQLQRQSSKDLSGSSMPLPKKPRYPSQPGYQEQILRQKRKQQHKSPQQQRHPQHHLRQGSFNPEIQQKLMSQGPALYNPEDYLSISMARRDMAEKMSKPRCNDSIPDTSSVDRDSMLSQHCLNIISPPDNEQQKCLNDIEQQVLSEVSYPMLLTMTSSDSRSTNIYPRSNNNVRMNYNSDTMNNRMSNTMSYQDIRDSTTTKSSFMDTFQMNNHRFPANQETMIQKRLESGKTHKEIMMMVSRDLQTRGGGGQLTGAAPQQHHQPPPPQLQHQSRLSQEYLPMQQQQILPPQRRHPPMHVPLSPSRNQSHFQAPLSQSRTGYPVSHAMMLRELEEKVENEMAEAAADQAAAAVGLRFDAYGGLIPPTKRRNSRAFAA